MKVALCQTIIEWENKETNIRIAEKYIKEASLNEAKIVFFPEMSFTGFSMNIKVTKEDRDESLNKVIMLAQKYQMVIGFGWVKANGEKAENHYTVIDTNGKILLDYIKIHSFLYGGEGEQFISGNTVCTFRYEGIEIALFICYDLRFPEIFRSVQNKADVFVVPANWPAVRREHWNTLLRARAIENQCYVLGVNCVGNIGSLEYAGESSIIEPDGTIAGSLLNKEGIIYGFIWKEKLLIRKSFPVMADRKNKLYTAYYQES